MNYKDILKRAELEKEKEDEKNKIEENDLRNNYHKQLINLKSISKQIDIKLNDISLDFEKYKIQIIKTELSGKNSTTENLKLNYLPNLKFRIIFYRNSRKYMVIFTVMNKYPYNENSSVFIIEDLPSRSHKDVFDGYLERLRKCLNPITNKSYETFEDCFDTFVDN